MNWKNFGYACCLSCGFNFVLFQVLFVHLKFGQTSVELPPDKIPTASHACLTCGFLNLAIVLVTVCYLKGVIKFNPIHYLMRIFNMAGRHGPATGASRYRRFTDTMSGMAPLPESARDYEQTTASHITSNLSNLSESNVSEKLNMPGLSTSQSSRSVVPPPPSQTDLSMLVNRSLSSNRTPPEGRVEKKPSFEMIDLN